MVGNLSQALVRFMRSVADALSGPRNEVLDLTQCPINAPAVSDQSLEKSGLPGTNPANFLQARF